ALVTQEYIHHGRAHSLQLHDIPDNVAIYPIHGPFPFGATDKLLELEADVPSRPKGVSLRLGDTTAIDGTGPPALHRSAALLPAPSIRCQFRPFPATSERRATCTTGRFQLETTP